MRIRPAVHIIFIILLAFLCTGCSVLVARTRLEPPDVFDRAAAFIEKNYIDKSGRNVTLDRSMRPDISGLLAQIDPSSILLSDEDAKPIDAILTTATGIQLVSKDGVFEIARTLPKTPARKAGLRRGEKILEINGSVVTGLPFPRVDNMLQGPPGTEIAIKVANRSGEERVVRLTREIVTIRSISERLIEKNNGYLRIDSFGLKAAAEVKAAVKRLLKKEMQGLIIDLRNNAGGMLTSITDVARLFLPAQKTIAVIKGSSDQEPKVYTTSGRSSYTEFPLVILIDANTQSGAEIVAAALKDNGRAVLVGEKSAGKCDIQTVFPLGDGSLLRVRTGLAYRANDEAIDGNGVKPDREIVLPKEEQDLIYEGLDPADVNFGNSSTDIQLKAALQTISASTPGTN